MKHRALSWLCLISLQAAPALAKTPYDGTWDFAVQNKPPEAANRWRGFGWSFRTAECPVQVTFRAM